MPLDRVDETYEAKMAEFEAECNGGKGDAQACHNVAEFYTVVKDNFEKAAKVYSTNCSDKQYMPSCFSLGRFHLAGKGVEQNDEKALELFDKGCNAGLLPACYFQAMLLHTGLTPPGSVFETPMLETFFSNDPNSHNKEPALAKSAASPAAPTPAAGAPNAVKPTKTAQQLAEEKANQEKALVLFDKACRLGEQNSCYFLGNRLLCKKNPTRDPTKAMPYLQLACDANHAPSCFNLAVLYNHGDTGVPKNSKLFEKYKNKTNELVEVLGSLEGKKTN